MEVAGLLMSSLCHRTNEPVRYVLVPTSQEWSKTGYIHI